MGWILFWLWVSCVRYVVRFLFVFLFVRVMCFGLMFRGVVWVNVYFSVVYMFLSGLGKGVFGVKW